MDYDLGSLSDEELAALAVAVGSEQGRRVTLHQVPQQINEMNRRYLVAAGVQQGEEWVRPTVAAEAYPLDWRVTHGGKTWVSTAYSNVWEPGVSGWQESASE